MRTALTTLRLLRSSIRPSMTKAVHTKALTLQTINPAVLDVEYAVRGELAVKADTYQHQLAEEGKNCKLPFDKIVTANIGNPQQKGLDQIPITYWRQVGTDCGLHYTTLISLPR